LRFGEAGANPLSGNAAEIVVVPVASTGNTTVRYPSELCLRRDFVQTTLARRFTEAEIVELLRAS
jgi:hypothetical protein